MSKMSNKWVKVDVPKGNPIKGEIFGLYGHWNIIRKGHRNTLVSCSECGKRFHIPNYCFKSERDRWKCCPICEAKMKGADDE